MVLLYKLYERSKAKRGRIEFLFDKKINDSSLKKILSLKKLKNYLKNNKTHKREK